MYIGNLIGKRRILYQGNAGGIWKPSEVHNAVSEKIWPTTGIYVLNLQNESGVSSITPAAGIIAGDLLLFGNFINSTTAAVAPSGFTNIYNLSRSVGGTERITLYYKIAVGTESGVALNGITNSNIAFYHLRWLKQPITSVSVQGLTFDTTFNDTITKTLTLSGETNGNPIVLFHGHRSFYTPAYYYTSSNYELPNYGIFDVRNSTNLINYYNNPTNNPNISYGFSGNIGTVFIPGLKIFNYSGTPDISIITKGDGVFNIMGCGYLRIT